MNENVKNIRRQVAECIKHFLEGQVSCDHLIEEFRNSDDEETQGVIRMIEKATEDIDKYAKIEKHEIEFKEKMEKLIEKLESS